VRITIKKPLAIALLIICAGLTASLFLQILQNTNYSFAQTHVLQYTQVLPAKTTLIAVGDIMLGRTVEEKIHKYQDYTYPFQETYQVTTTGDVVFGNLEAPLIDGPTVPAYNMVFRTDPQVTEGLTLGGFNVLSLANNHMKNYGDEGINKTIEQLETSDIKHVGAGSNAAGAREPAIVEVDEIKFGFLAYTDSSFTPASYEATDHRSGSPFMDIEQLIGDINTLKEKIDVIVVSMHAGNEYAPKPTQKQIDFAHAAIDNGAALVIGHHPHVLQPMEQYNDGYIIYSLGNFIFDQMWSETTRQGIIAKITFTDELIENVEFIPIKIYDYSQPRILTDNGEKKIINYMRNFTY